MTNMSDITTKIILVWHDFAAEKEKVAVTVP